MGAHCTHKWSYTGEKPLKCELCEKGFTQSGYLTKHKWSDIGAKPFKCDLCENGFTKCDC